MDFTDVKTGFVYTPDSRDLGYPMGAELETQQVAPLALPDYKFWVPQQPVDQGQTNSCVGYTCEGWQRCSPTRTKNPTPGLVIYRRALQIDEFWGEEDNGTSLRAGVKVLEELGRVERYVWAFSAEEVRQWVLGLGPVIVGTPFTTGMRDVRAPGWYMDISGQPMGGHAYLLTGYSRTRHAFRMINSWGLRWGDKGRAWLRYQDLDSLLRSQGGAVGVVEKALAA